MIEKESERGGNTPSFVASSSLSIFPRATNCCLSRLGKAEMERCNGEKKKGGRWEADRARQTAYPPSRPTLHPSSPLLLTAVICFPLCVIRTRWIQLSSLASLLLNCPPSSQPPFSSLSPPGFAHLWHPTDFVTLWFLARREKYQAESPFHQAKDEGLTERKHEEEALGTQVGLSLSLLWLLSIYFPYLVCLLGSYFHFCWFVALLLDLCCKYNAAKQYSVLSILMLELRVDATWFSSGLSSQETLISHIL